MHLHWNVYAVSTNSSKVWNPHFLHLRYSSSHKIVFQSLRFRPRGTKVLTLQKSQRIVSDATGFVVVFVWRGLEQFQQLLCMSPKSFEKNNKMQYPFHVHLSCVRVGVVLVVAFQFSPEFFSDFLSMLDLASIWFCGFPDSPTLKSCVCERLLAGFQSLAFILNCPFCFVLGWQKMALRCS